MSSHDGRLLLAASCTTAAVLGALAYHVVQQRRSAADRWRLARAVALASVRLSKRDDDDVDSDEEADALAVARNLAAEAVPMAPPVYRSIGSLLSFFSSSSNLASRSPTSMEHKSLVKESFGTSAALPSSLSDAMAPAEASE